jgi:hypothetical protein
MPGASPHDHIALRTPRRRAESISKKEIAGLAAAACERTRETRKD